MGESPERSLTAYPLIPLRTFIKPSMASYGSPATGFEPKRCRLMLESFTIQNRRGETFTTSCERFNGLYWRLVVKNSKAEEVGELLFRRDDAVSVELWEIEIYPEFGGTGIGTELLKSFLVALQQKGFQRVIAICKASDRLLSNKERLASWYERHGFTLTRESVDNQPGYMGTLTKELQNT